MSSGARVSGRGGRADQAAASTARLLFRHVFPRVNNRGAGRLERMPWLRDRRVLVCENGVSMTVPAFDAYWGRFFYRNVPYEPEVAAALELLGAVSPATFLDCGANYGYWAVRVAAGQFGEHRVIAVEASEATYQLLRQNLSGRGEAIHAAVSDKPGTVSFNDDQPHQARQITTEAGGVTVTATTIDVLADQADRVLVKLDVEGAEPAALEGSAGALARADVAFMYEDHGSDFMCAATRAMETFGLSIYHVDNSGRSVRLTSIDDVESRKTDVAVGYNFVAVSPGGRYEAAMESRAT
jgi:FkbM family methyltransferase